MSNYRRPGKVGGLYFFTVVSHRRQPVLCRSDIRAALRQAVLEVRGRYPFRIHGWVLLPDHLHTLWEVPVNDGDIGRRWSIIKRLVTQTVAMGGDDRLTCSSRLTRREGGLWQRRFWEHSIRDGHDYRQHMNYLHWNPVKHGFAEQVAGWPYSTFHRLVREGVYPRDWGGENVRHLSGTQFGE